MSPPKFGLVSRNPVPKLRMIDETCCLTDIPLNIKYSGVWCDRLSRLEPSVRPHTALALTARQTRHILCQLPGDGPRITGEFADIRGVFDMAGSRRYPIARGRAKLLTFQQPEMPLLRIEGGYPADTAVIPLHFQTRPAPANATRPIYAARSRYIPNAPTLANAANAQVHRL
jgi:hypothetical protein